MKGTWLLDIFNKAPDLFILIIGRTKCGKSYVTNLIKDKWLPDSNYIEISSLVKEVVGPKASREQLQLELKKHSSNPDWLFNALQKKIKAVNIIAGIREPYLLYKLLKQYSCKFIVIKLIVDDFIRYSRYIDKEYISIESFKQLEQRDNELLGLDILMNLEQSSVNENVRIYNVSSPNIEDPISSILFQHNIIKKVRN